MPVIYSNLYFNPRTYKQIHTPIVVQGGRGGGVDGTPHLAGFCCFPILRKKIAFEVARNSFVGCAQTGFQFTRETQKRNKQKWRRALAWI